jgi:CRP-like cAMP-binding protein
MDSSRRFSMPGRNRLLSALSPDLQHKLASGMEKVLVAPEQVLFEADTPITHVWFPLSGVISLAVTMKNDAMIEVATIGNEGFVGLPAAFGADRGLTKALGQVPGEAMKMRLEAFLRALQEHAEVRDLVQRYTVAMMNQITQSTACNQVHSVRERMCRWLLMTHDRVGGGDGFDLTQEFLSYMLGVRREGVSGASHELQALGIIRYRRGHVSVLDRPRLERAACECYRATRADYARLLG